MSWVARARRHAAILAALLLLGLAPAACGKKGDLKPPPGTESDFPRQYPNPNPDEQ
jgi:predicted small lipoprotein YifL